MGDRIDLTNNKGPLVNIAAWFCLSAAVLAAAAKVYTNLFMIKRLNLSDAAVVSAMLFSVALTVSTALQVDAGLGRDEQTLSASQIDEFYLTGYVSSLFYVLATFIPKFAIVHFFLHLTRKGPVLRAIQGMGYLLILWIATSVLVQSFQCSLPRPWFLQRPSGQCINGVAFWIVHGVIDLITQLPLAFLPFYLLRDLQTETRRKMIAMLAFTPNILTIPLIITRMIYLPGLYTSTNPTQNSWILFLVSVIHANIAVVVTTMSFAKPILDSLSIGVINNDVAVGLVWDKRSINVSTQGRSRNLSVGLVKSGERNIFASAKKDSSGSGSGGRFSSRSRTRTSQAESMADLVEMEEREGTRRSTIETIVETVEVKQG